MGAHSPARQNLYPRSPCGERPEQYLRPSTSITISIHALLAESDSIARATSWTIPISIHALLAESDMATAQAVTDTKLISIHALLAESDADRIGYAVRLLYFYPRSPCGERHPAQTQADQRGNFYPRSPCGERPQNTSTNRPRGYNFYPRSPCGERRRKNRTQHKKRHNFYPRSPCGERRQAMKQ